MTTNPPAPKLTQLSQQRLELAARLLRQKSGSAAKAPASAPSIPRRPRTSAPSVFPLSFTQQRLWILDQLEPGLAAYYIPTAVRFTGKLDLGVLTQCLNEIGRRHEVLRTTFGVEAEQPVQVIHPAAAQTLPLVDLTPLEETLRESELARMIKAELHQPFDLTHGPLLRLSLFRLGAADHILLLVIHHIICDGWSLGVIIREITALYQVFSMGQAPALSTLSPELVEGSKGEGLPELPIQYADYAAWQREWFQGEVLEAQLAYWKKQLADAAPVLELPTDHPRPAAQSFRGAGQMLTVPSGITEALKALSQREGVTLFMTMLAAFQTLLHRYSGQGDIVVGTPIANRTRAETEGLIGYFANMLALRTNLAGDPTFLDLLRQVRETALGAYAHQDMPFEYLVEALGLERDLSRNPLFQVLFGLHNAPIPPFELPGLTISRPTLKAETSRFDLALDMWESAGEFVGALEYNTDLFDDATLTRMIEHFQTLLVGIVADPARRLSQLPLLTDAERQQALIEWNATHAAYPQARCVHQLVEAQAEQIPDAVAVVFDDGHVGATHASPQHLTYQALHHRAQQLAQHLQNLGVGPEVRVGVCLERSLEMVIGLLGVLKAGGAYVPLDPAYPSERLAYMLEDSQATVLLTHSHLLQTPNREEREIPTPNPLITICLDTEWASLNQQSAIRNLQSALFPDNPAYVLYTSGSTGRPKGVPIPHRALVNFLCSVQHEPGLIPTDVLLSVTTVAFDIFGLELYLPLITGARVELASRETAMDGVLLRQQLHTSGATVMQATPATWRLLLDTVEEEADTSQLDLSGLKILCGGEALPRSLADRLLATGGELWNLYGPTETTIWSSVQRIEAEDGLIVIGRPLANTQFYILDPHGQPAPIGVIGELHIGGDGLARGYLGRPELTAEKFVPNPFVTTEDEGRRTNDERENLRPSSSVLRLYKTGDLARYLPNGTIQLLGRIDHQIKLRGYRIELGEIETALKRHPAVREAVALVREDIPGDQRLVAYLVANNDGGPLRATDDGGGTKDEGRRTNVIDPSSRAAVLRPSSADLSPTELRAFLKAGLPEYMLPSAFVFLEKLPLTPNGKLDRKALPAVARVTAENYVAPRDATEITLAKIWADLLGLERVSIHDNFFALGGDSLLAVRVIAQAGQAGLHFSTKLFFQHQTIAELSRAVVGAPEINAEQGPVVGPVPLTPILHWYFDLGLSNPHFNNLALLLETPPGLDPAPLTPAVQAILTHHDALRSRFERGVSGWEMRIVAPEAETATVDRFDLSGLPPSERRSVLEATAAQLQTSLNLSHGPLLRVAHFDLGPALPGRLLFLCHHLVIDAFSLQVVLADLMTAYEQIRQGQTVQLPRKTTSLKYWAERLADYAHSETLQSELNDWLSLPWHQIAPLPVDFPAERENNLQGRIETTAALLSVEETTALLEQVRSADDLHVADFLLTALRSAFAPWIGDRPLLVDLVGHGREPLFDDVDLSRTAHWGISLVPLFLRAAGDPLQALHATRDSRRWLPQGGIGFGVLRYLGEGLGRGLPGAEVQFSYLGQARPEADVSRLRLAPESPGITINPSNKRPELFYCHSHIQQGQLFFRFAYGENLYRRATVEKLAGDFLGALRMLIRAHGAEINSTFVAPRNPVEEALAGIWTQLLGVERVSVEDNFFELGGHSLLATRVNSRVRQAFQVDLPLRALFENPTLADLANRIQALQTEAAVPTQSIPHTPRDQALPLSFAQERLWFLSQLDPDVSIYNIPAVLRFEGELDLAALEQSMNEVLRRHEILRTTFSLEDPGRLHASGEAPRSQPASARAEYLANARVDAGWEQSDLVHLHVAGASGQPIQIIHPFAPYSLPVFDLTSLPAAAREGEAFRRGAAELKRPFDLVHGPLLRLNLFRLSATEHLLFLTVHHLLTDGWSMGVLIGEVTALYSAFSASKGEGLSELPIQYADYAVWQRRWLQGETLETQLAYWKKNLAGVPTILELPTDHPRPAVQTFRGATLPVALPGALTVSLKALSAQAGATLFMTLLAAFQTLLYRYTGQAALLVGTAIANRTRAETEGMIGPFANTLLMRADLSGDLTFQQLLARTQALALEAYAHQDLPFEYLVEALHLERDLSRNPLFQVLFGLHNTPAPTLTLPGLTISRLEAQAEGARFDLSLDLWETAEGLSGMVQYSTDLFEAATIRRFIVHFQTLLESIATNPAQPLSQLSLLKETERQQLLVEWNATQAAYPPARCVHQLVEAQAEQTPDAVAVVFDAEGVGAKHSSRDVSSMTALSNASPLHLTYSELNHRAHQLAQHLQGLGVGPEVRVGVCLDRSLEMVVGLLGVLKVGGAYVPLDPSYPPDRLAYMLEDSQAAVLLTHSHLLQTPNFSQIPEAGRRGQTPTPKSLATICLDTEWGSINQQSAIRNHQSAIFPDNPAYVLYTSGSTGRPKGVPIPHRALVNFLCSVQREPGLNSADVLLSVTTVAFDIFGLELYLPLITGARVELASRETAMDGALLRQQLLTSGATVMQATPATWRLLLDTVEEEADSSALDLSGLKILCGGEALPRPLADRLLATGGELWNLYGPTETTIWSSVQKIDSAPGPIVIGRPLANTQFYILDQHGQPVPLGVLGELHIGGDGLARGYLGRPDLTAEKFIPNPFLSKDEGGTLRVKDEAKNPFILHPSSLILYKTGDLARYLPNGNIELLGRADHQVKLRGYRIELGEIEVVLGQHPAVRACAVVVRSAGHGESQQLVAYVVAQGEPLPTPLELRQFIKESLPEYMLPSAFVFLETLPLTPNGKLDRKALPAPDGTRPELESVYVAPRSPTEATLARIWAERLNLERVGIHDNFFTLGGDSLLAVRVIAQAGQAGLRFSTKLFFQHQTIAELAQALQTAPELKAEQGPVVGPVPLTPILHWYFDLDVENPHLNNIAVLFETPPGLDPAPLAPAVQQLLLHHDVLRTRFERGVSGWQARIVEPDLESVPLIGIDLSTVPPTASSAVIQAACAELQAGLHLTRGPLLRIAYFDLGPAQPGRVLLVFHHLISDAFSVPVLLADLATAYEQLSRSEAVRLPPKTTSVKEWAERLVEYARSETLQAEVDYWLSLPWDQVAPLPVDFPAERANNLQGPVKTTSVWLSVAETDSLMEQIRLADELHITDFLLAALRFAFAPWTGDRPLLVDLVGHGREPLFDDIDLSRTTLWSITLAPVFLEAAVNPLQALYATRALRRQLPQRGIGFGLLRYLGEGLGREFPRAEVQFSYLGQPARPEPKKEGDSAPPRLIIRPAPEPMEGMIDPRNKRPELFYCHSLIREGQLFMRFAYADNLHRRDTVEKLAADFLEALRTLIHVHGSKTNSIPAHQAPTQRPALRSQPASARAFARDSARADAGWEQSQNWRMHPQAPAPQPVPVIQRLSRAHPLPLSFAQERLWFLHQLAPDSPAYNLPATVRLLGPLDLQAAERSLNEIVRRHEVLRTTFPSSDGLPLQVIAPALTLSLPLIDLRDRPATEREAEARRWASDEARRPFDLSRGPLVRAALVRLDTTDQLLVLTLHHIISDGWSMGAILVGELAALYNAYTQGQAAAMPELPIQYADFAAWQRNWLQGETLQAELDYWKQKLTDAPPQIDLPTDYPRPAQQTFRGARQSLRLSAELSEALQALSRREGVTLFTVLLAGLKTLLYQWTGQSDLVVGTVIANRNRVEIEPLIGCFMNFLALRSTVAGELNGRELLAQLRGTVLEAYTHQDCPFEKVVEALNPDRRGGGNPLYNVGLLMQNFPHLQAFGRGLQAQAFPLETPAALLDLRWIVDQMPEGLSLQCEYNTDLFTAQTIEWLVEACRRTLEQLAARPETRLENFALPVELVAQARSAQARDRKQTLAIAATFTAEPLAAALNFWMKELGRSTRVEFAPYNQVFQQLLDPSSLLATNSTGANLLLIRLEDWQDIGDATRNQVSRKPTNESEEEPRNLVSLDLDTLKQTVREFAAALKASIERTPVPHLVCLCPSTPPAAALLTELETQLAEDLANVPGVSVLTSAEVLAAYPVTQVDDPYSDELGHIPYTEAFFVALATSLARRLEALHRPPYKVIVLDCDQTLWGGVVGEDGPLGITVDPPRQALQEFMRAQAQAGKLLCLCSKNNESDVLEVFARRPEMRLRREDLVAWRINWQPKSENLRALAAELGLGLDSFIFLDDNPLECAEVQAQCPEVLTLQLPAEPLAWTHFLAHVWAFDRLPQTAEDRQRTALYQQNAAREHLRREAPSLATFLAGLQLEINIVQPVAAQLARVAQLTQRTNQFNLTTLRRTESEIRNGVSEGLECLIVEVRDRFGDYGLVGVMLYCVEAEALHVDSFLLSCRALGRGVEHRMLARLGEIAQLRGLGRVDLSFIPTEKNRPALDFLESVGAQFKNNSETGCVFHFPAAYAATITYKPVEPSADGTNGAEKVRPHPALPHHGEQSLVKSKALVAVMGEGAGGGPSVDSKYDARIASELSTISQILAVLRSSPLKRQQSAAEYVAPRNATETTLANLWAELLGLERVGIHDDFFALGGHSLLATQALSRVRDTFQVELPLQTVFAGAFTLAELARVIGENQVKQSETEDVLALMEKLGELSDEQVKELLEREGTIV